MHVLSKQFHRSVKNTLPDDHLPYNRIPDDARTIDQQTISVEREKRTERLTECKMINVGIWWAGKNCISMIFCSAILDDYFQEEGKEAMENKLDIETIQGFCIGFFRGKIFQID